MPLIVPILRLAYVFSNVFETFKTLRPPPPSSRNSGQPSLRALSQRKRAMKGCMAVWLCWVCFTMYERTLDGVIRVFIPFYDEIKSLVILFFLISRAKGAEPIYLHVLRPVIKPYTSTLDILLEAGHMIGDFVLLAASIPVNSVLAHWRKWTHSDKDPFHEDDSLREKRGAQRPDDVVPPFIREAANGARPQAKRKGSSNSSSSSSRDRSAQRAASQHAFVPITASAVPQPAARTSRASRIYREPSQGAQPPPPPYERWYPPTSAYADRSGSGLPTPPADSPPPFEAVQAEILAADAEWRQYPDFPAAYPPTPLQTAAPSLPGADGLVAPVPLRAPQFAGIPEEDAGESDEEDEDGEGNATVRQGFRRSLLLPREFMNPDSAGDLSDEHEQPGIQSTEVHSDNGMDIDAHGDEDASMGSSDDQSEPDSEDDFDVTLRTPRRMRVRSKTRDDTIKARRNVYGLATTSAESLASNSTKLSTTDNGSSLRTMTRTNSEASHSSRLSSAAPSGSDAASIVGRKRRIATAIPRAPSTRETRSADRDPAAPGSKTSTKAAAAERVKKTKAAGARPTAVQMQTRMRMRAATRAAGGASDASDEDTAATDSDLSDSAVSSDLKRRRVPGAPGERGNLPATSVRPRTRREDSERTIRPPRARDKSASHAVSEETEAPTLRPRPARTTSRNSTRSRR
ncbi:uncharacterized protein C8Q71DRAFT_732208 [Rhodofomes roseus]|uniref:Protein YOP1 n=1 Tax=Rhodofomes roseus TaxID=34475 RepID=A0ABQ8KZX7_9APHY|nr:uncharacterized protein C8Q71DRAFT_732208 [Rhodofomes roseus]KAH9844345.1 hypothetical protein C8Q71DRAFT_732208 [Rhodofomes roseus]